MNWQDFKKNISIEQVAVHLGYKYSIEKGKGKYLEFSNQNEKIIIKKADAGNTDMYFTISERYKI